MNKITSLEKILAEARVEAEKLYGKNNKASSVRLRAQMQDLKKLANEVRADATEHKKKIPKKKSNGPPPRAPAKKSGK